MNSLKILCPCLWSRGKSTEKRRSRSCLGVGDLSISSSHIWSLLYSWVRQKHMPMMGCVLSLWMTPGLVHSQRGIQNHKVVLFRCPPRDTQCGPLQCKTKAGDLSPSSNSKAVWSCKIQFWEFISGGSGGDRQRGNRRLLTKRVQQ